MSAALETIHEYLSDYLPAHLTRQDHEELGRIGVPVAVLLRDGSGEERLCFQETEDGFKMLENTAPAECSFHMASEVFETLITGKKTPQWAFFTGKVRIEGSKLLALRVASLLEGIFRRLPYDRKASTGRTSASLRALKSRPLSDHQRRVIDLHLDPDGGAPFWIAAADRLGIRSGDLRTFHDLAVFGSFDRQAAAVIPFRQFIPSSVLARRPHLILGETAGTTGLPLTSAWQPAEFESAFISPLLRVLGKRGVTGLQQWLFVGPTGPHIIGKAAEALAVATTGTEALRVDFDPRWHRKLAAGSYAAGRHLEHLLGQARVLLRREQIDALFITPTVLQELLVDGGQDWLAHLHVVHLGGQSITRERTLQFRGALPSHTHLINGYGNSMFGCVVEEEEPVTYRFPEERHQIRLCVPGQLEQEAAEGEIGQVVSYRFDETMMLLNVAERDEADHGGIAFSNPRPLEVTRDVVSGGIY